MNRRRGIAAVLLGVPALARAQRAGAPARVGLLGIGADPQRRTEWQPFIEGLRALGYTEGANLQIETAFAGGDATRIEALPQDLVRRGVDVIVTTGNRETRAALNASPGAPVVMLFVPDPVAQGFVQSLARPGGNVTGLTNMVPGLSQKYVELMRELLPDARQLAVVTSPSNPVAEHRAELEAAARRVNVDIRYVQVTAAPGFAQELARARKDGAQGIIVTQDPLTYLHRQALTDAARSLRLPGLYWLREYVQAGGLMTYSASRPDLMRRGAAHVDKLLRGARAAELPVEQPTLFELVINAGTARAIGLPVPRSLLLRADEVIE